jgi:hypothetical protein
MFPITARTAPRIVVPNLAPAINSPLFIKESEAGKANKNRSQSGSPVHPFERVLSS